MSEKTDWRILLRVSARGGPGAGGAVAYSDMAVFPDITVEEITDADRETIRQIVLRANKEMLALVDAIGRRPRSRLRLSAVEQSDPLGDY